MKDSVGVCWGGIYRRSIFSRKSGIPDGFMCLRLPCSPLRTEREYEGDLWHISADPFYLDEDFPPEEIANKIWQEWNTINQSLEKGLKTFPPRNDIWLICVRLRLDASELSSQSIHYIFNRRILLFSNGFSKPREREKTRYFYMSGNAENFNGSVEINWEKDERKRGESLCMMIRDWMNGN